MILKYIIFYTFVSSCMCQKISVLLKAKNQNTYESENIFWNNVSASFYKQYGILTEITLANSVKGSASQNYIPFIESALNSTEKSDFDIIQIDFPFIGVFDQYLSDISAYRSVFDNKFIHGTLNNLISRDNKLKGIPLHLDFGVLFSNQDTKIPSTYDEMFNICKNKNNINNNCYLYQNAGEAYSAVINEWITDANNGQYISEHSIINLSNINVKNFINILYNNSKLLPNTPILNSDELVTRLNENKTMFTRNWLSTYSFHINKTVNILPYYITSGSTLGGFFLGVVENRKYINLENIITFLSYIITENVQYSRLRLFNHIPAIPIDTMVLQDYCINFPCNIITKLNIISRPSKYAQVKNKYRDVSNILTSRFNISFITQDIIKNIEIDIQNIINPQINIYIIIFTIVGIILIILIVVIVYLYTKKFKKTKNKEHIDYIEVLNEYIASNTDEMSVQPGELIRVVEIYSDNWAYGINNENNKQGIIPMYVFGNIYMK